MIKLYFMIGGLAWFFICMLIALLTSNKNKWGPDAVENYCNQNTDNFNMILWMTLAITGLGVTLLFGGFEW